MIVEITETETGEIIYPVLVPVERAGKVVYVSTR